MGEIRVVHDRRLQRPVLIKEIQQGAGASERAIRRFEREILISAGLQHPGIVNILDGGRWASGDPFYVMQRIRGQDLAETIKGLETLHERLSKLSIVLDVANAMAYAHAQKIIHRDLKPANILVGHFGETVIIDWGLAKIVGEGEDSSSGRALLERDGEAPLTIQGSVMGTPAYMAPEQAEGNDLDERADVYAIGAILYHLLGGHPPYQGSSRAVIFKLLEKRPPERSLDQVDGSIPAALVSIVNKAMHLDREARYRTAHQLAQDLKRFVNGQLVGAHSYSVMGLVRRWVERNKALVLSVSVALFVLAIGGVYSVQKIRVERDKASQANADLFHLNKEMHEKNEQLIKRGEEIREINEALVSRSHEISEKLEIIEGQKQTLQAQKNVLTAQLDEIQRLNQATLVVHGWPSGAQVRVNGEPVAQLAGAGVMRTIKLHEGTYAIDVAHGAYVTQHLDVSLAARQTQAIEGFLLLPIDGTPPAGMVKVPEGPFLMGCDPQRLSGCERDEQPARVHSLDPFLIDRTEVTVAAYRLCVEAGACQIPEGVHSESPHFNWGAAGRDLHPINGLDWPQASRYCQWIGKRLPTEAEWEKAARGPDGAPFPWGDHALTHPLGFDPCTVAVVKGCAEGTLPVGSKPAGASPYGALDMAGNVWEWTADWYDAKYYSASPEINPEGPKTGPARVPRGGGFRYDLHGVRSYNRVNGVPSDAHFNLGMRCAQRAHTPQADR
jgi:formylglycine-generating enzyme required for sulfatase activity/serine/threonine protein kinase